MTKTLNSFQVPLSPSRNNGMNALKERRSPTPKSRTKSSKIRSSNYEINFQKQSWCRSVQRPPTTSYSNSEISIRCIIRECKNRRRNWTKTSKDCMPCKVSTRRSMRNWWRSITLPWRKKHSSKFKGISSSRKHKIKRNHCLPFLLILVSPKEAKRLSLRPSPKRNPPKLAISSITNKLYSEKLRKVIAWLSARLYSTPKSPSLAQVAMICSGRFGQSINPSWLCQGKATRTGWAQCVFIREDTTCWQGQAIALWKYGISFIRPAPSLLKIIDSRSGVSISIDQGIMLQLDHWIRLVDFWI